ncbi:MAG: glucose-6-phosphate isomerase [Bacteroidota bacterium]
MIKVSVDVDNIETAVSSEELLQVEREMETHFQTLISQSGAGRDFLGWLTLPADVNDDLVARIDAEANSLRGNVEYMVVLGIGGSYLGTRAVVESLGHSFSMLNNGGNSPKILYAGQNISEDYIADLLDVLDKKDYALCVISKSGTTTETAIAFRILKAHIEEKYGVESARKRIIAITDKAKGALKKLADSEGYSTYVIPDDVGGRYSVLTPVGLLPVAVAGLNIRKLLDGAGCMQRHLAAPSSLKENPAIIYAAARNALYRKGKNVEIMVTYEPRLVSLTEWWKQLYGESEGKQHKGIFPAGVNFTTDLHSMGQYIQDGQRIIFETVLSVANSQRKVVIPENKENLDGLNFIAGKKLSEVNHVAESGTLLAHIDGGVPNIRISIPRLDEECLGQLIYFYEFACALSGYALGVNPFDQPGVEAYKNNMFALLGKPGYEAETKQMADKVKSGTNN